MSRHAWTLLLPDHFLLVIDERLIWLLALAKISFPAYPLLASVLRGWHLGEAGLGAVEVGCGAGCAR